MKFILTLIALCGNFTWLLDCDEIINMESVTAILSSYLIKCCVDFMHGYNHMHMSLA